MIDKVCLRVLAQRVRALLTSDEMTLSVPRFSFSLTLAAIALFVTHACGQFNDVCHWAATEVLLGTEARDRAETICMLLEVATHSRELNDFSTTMAILTALESASIARLHQSLDIIPLQSQLILDELKTLMSMEVSGFCGCWCWGGRGGGGCFGCFWCAGDAWVFAVL